MMRLVQSEDRTLNQPERLRASDVAYSAIRQGLAMGRPSEIALPLDVQSGVLRSVEIGGAAVLVSEGRLRV